MQTSRAEALPGLSDEKRALLQHLLDNPHHTPPLFRWMIRVRNGMSDESALHLLGQEIAAADAKQAGGMRL